MFTILYLQADENIAKNVKSHFSSEECEFLISTTGEEALTICEERRVFLFIVDANVPDMKQTELLKKVQQSFPTTFLAVCVDRPEVNYIADITSNPCVKKVFIPPWDIETMADEILETCDNYKIKEDYVSREKELATDEERFENTLNHLKESLIRQKYSYNKLHPLLDGTLLAFLQRGTVGNVTAVFIKNVCSRLLLWQTTATVNTDNLDELINKSLLDVSDKYKQKIRPGQISYSLGDSATRGALVNILFSIYFIASYEALKGRGAVINLNAAYDPVHGMNIEITAVGDEPAHVSNQEITEYLNMLLYASSQNSSINEEEITSKYRSKIK